MRRLIEEYGIVLLYIITGLLCILLFSAAFFGDNSSVSKVINSSIDSSANRDTSVVYKITLELNGGELPDGTSNPIEYTKEDQFVLPTPTKAGKLFAGWIGQGDTTPRPVYQINRGSVGNRTYTAVWTDGHYRIVYKSNLDNMITKYSSLPGWDILSYSQKETLVSSWMTGEETSILIEYGDPIPFPTSDSTFTFKGHNLISWNTNASVAAGLSREDNRVFAAGSTGTEDLLDRPVDLAVIQEIPLYAVWQQVEYNISYHHSNQGIQGVDNANNPVKYKITDMISLNKAVLQGYTLNYWYTRDPYLDYSADGYRNEYVQRYVAVKGTDGSVIKEDFANDEILYDSSGNRIYGKYNFIGAGTTGDLDLYSYFTRNEYRIAFLDQDGKSIEDSNALYYEDASHNKIYYYKKVYSLDSKVTLSNEQLPHLEGYDFLGWQIGLSDKRIDGTLKDTLILNSDVLTDSKLGYNEEAYKAAITASGEGTKFYQITLYPVFGPHQYLIYYSANGGYNAPASQVKTFGLSLTLSDASAMYRDGYTFKGWKADCSLAGSNQANCEAHQTTIYEGNTELEEVIHGYFADKATITEDLATDDMKSVTLTAIWEANPIIITLDLNMANITELQPKEAYDEEIRALRAEVRGFNSVNPTDMTMPANVYYGHSYGSSLPVLYMSPVTTQPETAYKYKFGGWYREKECINLVPSDELVSVSKEHTLYAKWIPINYIIRLHSNY